jgi:1-aminocyclopropane-1-carboxylate deaminase/D-cysteine desulfhydrase-like pyridoxal-dependent ACC family enzyme
LGDFTDFFRQAITLFLLRIYWHAKPQRYHQLIRMPPHSFKTAVIALLAIMILDSAALPLLKAVATSVVGLGVAIPVGAVAMLQRVSGSVGLAPPTKSMLAEENSKSECALFRYLPDMADKLAWRSLGALRTPIHTCRIPSLSGQMDLEFLIKRDDLISPVYGGNKVRTLQHQLAICEARRERGETSFRQLVAVGSAGSNQIVATVVHGRGLGWDGEEKDNAGPPSRVNLCYLDKDEPDLDNTLNMLSAFSFPSIGWIYNWGQISTLGASAFLSAIRGAWRQKDFVPMMLGGNCPSGVLGQAGGILELAEQISAGESPDPRRIYLPVGSSCTISGLIIGTVLARRIGIPALSHPDFKIVGCSVHDGGAKLEGIFGFYTNPRLDFLPLTVTHSVKAACAAMVELGGPNLEADALEFMKTSVEIRADPVVVGPYGGHSEATRAVARLYDEKGSAVDSAGKEAKHIWVCGHFVSKAFEPLLRDLEEAKSSSEVTPEYMLWMTKSAVQPRGSVDEWSIMLKENEQVLHWANEGKAESSLRPARVSTRDGSPNEYRSLMTKVL